MQGTRGLSEKSRSLIVGQQGGPELDFAVTGGRSAQQTLM